MTDINSKRFAVNTYSYTQTFEAKTCLKHLAERGFDTFELMMYPGHCWPADLDAPARREFGRFLSSAGLKIVSLNMPNIDIC